MKELIGTAVILATVVFIAQFAAKRLAQRTSAAKEIISPPTSVEEFLDRY